MDDAPSPKGADVEEKQLDEEKVENIVEGEEEQQPNLLAQPRLSDAQPYMSKPSMEPERKESAASPPL